MDPSPDTELSYCLKWLCWIALLLVVGSRRMMLIIGAAAILNVHALAHSTSTAAAPAPQRAPKLECPRIGLDSTSEEWNAFMRRWDTFRVGSRITLAFAPAQLLECAENQLMNIILRADPAFTTRTIADASGTFKSRPLKSAAPETRNLKRAPPSKKRRTSDSGAY